MQSLRLIYGQQALARSPWLAKGAGFLSGILEAKALLDLGLPGALELNCALQ
jgi:hypothetical protein